MKHSHGILTGLWFALVTMTTVGYGDITPKSVIEKSLTMVWMVTGVILTAILTSTITNAFGELDFLEMGDKQILVVNKSLEAWISTKFDSARLKTVDNYEILFEELIKKGSVGVVDTYVRRSHPNKLNDFRLVKVFPDWKIKLMYRYDAYNMLLPRLRDCVFLGQLKKVSTVVEKYELKSERHSVDIDMVDFFLEPSMFTISIVAASFITMSLLLEARIIFGLYTKKDDTFSNNNDKFSRAHNEFDVSNRSSHLELQLVAIKENLGTVNRKIEKLGDDISLIIDRLQLPSSGTK